MIAKHKRLIHNLMQQLKTQIVIKSKYRFAISNYKSPLISPQLKDSFYSKQQKPLLPTNFKSKQTEYVVLRNYILPARPKQYLHLHIFLSERNFEQADLSNKQWQYKIKNIDKTKLKKYKQLMEVQNVKIQIQQQEYDKVVKKCLKKLPFYYHMLLSKTQLQEKYMQIDTKELRQSLKINKSLDGDEKKENMGQGQSLESQKQNNLYLLIPKQQREKILTSQQIFLKLYSIHPLIKYKVYQEYTKIHNYYIKSHSKFSKIASRLPILYFTHPYELFIIDQYLNSKKQLHPNQFQISSQEISKYKQKWNQLPEGVRNQYEDKASKLILQYQLQMKNALQKTNLTTMRLFQLMQKQFSSENQKILHSIK